MSHESGISTSEELRQFIGTAKMGFVRSFKVVISNEKMELGGHYDAQSSLETDFNRSVAQYVDATKPCYIMIRLDGKNSDNNHHWLFILFCPDSAQTAEKMKYASTRSSFKRHFGSHLITSELFFDTKAEVNYQGYQDHVTSKKFPKALTDLEKFALEAKKNENQFYSTDSTAITLPKISLDSDSAVNRAFDDFYQNKCNYVQLGVNIETEKIVIFFTKNIEPEKIESLTPQNEPRFHIVNFQYNKNGISLTDKVFIYSAPGFKATVKQRMMYSTCKSSVIESYEKGRDKFSKKIEVEDMLEINSDFLIHALQPPQHTTNQLFKKPQRPGRR